MGYEQRVIAPACAEIGNAMADGGDSPASINSEMSLAVISAVVAATQGQHVNRLTLLLLSALRAVFLLTLA